MVADKPLAGRIAVVVDAEHELGREIAVRLGEAGAVVLLGGRDEAALNETGQLVRTTNTPWCALNVDPTDESSVESFGQDIITGAGVPDVVICNGYDNRGRSEPIWAVGIEDWNTTFTINVTSAFLILRTFLPAMTERGSGSAVLIATMRGTSATFALPAPHAVSDMALIGLARTAARDAAPFGVRVNVISVGHLHDQSASIRPSRRSSQGPKSQVVPAHRSPEPPIRQRVHPRDVADAVLFLAGDGSRSVTGADLQVTGGGSSTSDQSQ
jgi:NAD(P)-dependent dehydrogenase (short-subunit alcohol dehydrogenase family)